MKEITKELLSRYASGFCTDQERLEVERWYQSYHPPGIRDLAFRDLEQDLRSVERRLPGAPGWRQRRIQVAAAILLIAGIGMWFYRSRPSGFRQQEANARMQDVAPGVNQAILTLSDGSRITLGDAASGEVARQSGTRITKVAKGQLFYSQSGREGGTGLAYNKIETPRGGQYEIRLPDGTHVWLNSASWLRYPACFTGKLREVELNGEAYFEVSPDKRHPFKVRTAKQEVEVLGTHFNINSYADEGTTRTTLLEGRVKVSQGNKSAYLHPGEQSQVGATIEVGQADVEESVAWKNGKTQFSNADIGSIMRMLSRWYNVEVEYQGEVGELHFGGSVSRSKNLSEVLKVLELTGEVHFKIEGRRVTVMR